MKLLATFVLAVGTLFVGSASAQTPPPLTICTGKYALCAASTCTKTGKTITTNNGVTYPEVVCRCPVLNGRSIADLSAGVMKGTCDVERPNVEVWSLFAPKVHYPQEANNFATGSRQLTRAKVQSCPGALAEGSANCWGMLCVYDPQPTNGTVTATCSCPIGQIARGTKFLTEAGQGDKAACAKHPVAAPDPFGTYTLY